MSHRALKRALKSLQTQSSIENVSSTIYTYLKERWQLQTDKMDPLYVEQELSGIIPPEELEDLIQLLKDCDAGRYAPGIMTDQDIAGTAGILLKKVDSHA